jgi:hypothetical protein
MTFGTGAAVMIAWRDSTAGSLREDHPHTEGSFGSIHPRNNLHWLHECSSPKFWASSSLGLMSYAPTMCLLTLWTICYCWSVMCHCNALGHNRVHPFIWQWQQQCSWVVMAWLGDSLEAVASPVRPGSTAAHQVALCRARTMVRSPKEVSVYIAGDCQWQKHTEKAHPLVDDGRQNVQP